MAAGSGRGRELVRVHASDVSEVERYVAESAGAKLLLRDLEHSTMASSPLLIRGETGTGKTLLARTIHGFGKPLHALRIVSCAALSDGLLAEVLGAPDTDARDETLLLDEVGELSPWGQAVVVQWLSIAAPRQLLATTQRDLPALAATGQFSPALLECLGGEHVRLAPLRKRRDEIVPLALHFLGLALATTHTPCASVEREVLDALTKHRWPGNARELKNAMFRALAFNDSGVLTLLDLPERVRGETSRITCE
jgi:NtrC-family two-component system response regulator AlgB